MASLIQKINNYRIKISSCKKIYKPESHDFSCFNNTKLINLNTWDLLTNGKIIKYSLVYTNPYLINKSIVKILGQHGMTLHRLLQATLQLTRTVDNKLLMLLNTT